MSKDIDGLSGYPQAPNGADFSSMSSLEGKSEADRAAQSMVDSLRDGTNTDNRMSELRADYPGQREADDLVDPVHIEDDLYHTCGEWQQRQWKDSDNTGGEGVPAPDMPVFIQPEKPKPKKPY